MERISLLRPTSFIRRVVTLRPEEGVLLGHALALVLAVRISLWLLPSRVIVRRVHSTSTRAPEGRCSGVRAEQIAWAIDAASRRVPRASCLTQAVAGQILLRHHGIDSILRVGVIRRGTGFRAHAWIEEAGRILIGGAESKQFTPMVEFSAGDQVVRRPPEPSHSASAP